MVEALNAIVWTIDHSGLLKSTHSLGEEVLADTPVLQFKDAPIVTSSEAMQDVWISGRTVGSGGLGDTKNSALMPMDETSTVARRESQVHTLVSMLNSQF